jgi:hypothetical protein
MMSDSIVVEIAGLPVGFTAVHGQMRRLLLERYRNFLSRSTTTAAEFDVDVVEDPPCGAEPELRVEADGDVWRMARGDFDATWDASTRRGRITQTLNPYSTDSVLRIVHSLLLGADAGFLLHASSLVADGRAYVFTGQSGAGKTTMAMMAPAGSMLLTDEISCIRRTADGWTAFGTPFAGELGTSGEQVSAPLAGIFRLVQGPGNRIDAMTPAQAVRTLMRNILFFTPDRDALVLDIVCALAAAVPVRTLTFAKDPEVWDLVRGRR